MMSLFKIMIVKDQDGYSEILIQMTLKDIKKKAFCLPQYVIDQESRTLKAKSQMNQISLLKTNLLKQ